MVQKMSPFPNPSPAAPAGSIHAKTKMSASELNRKYLSTDTAFESNQLLVCLLASLMQKDYHSCMLIATDAFDFPLMHFQMVSAKNSAYNFVC
ncbi:MAG: hypothetical protein RL417_765 [Pseudomonadota bacterium]